MPKAILITGSTDGIGVETARRLVSLGHRVALHGRDQEKLNGVRDELAQTTGGEVIASYLGDLSTIAAVDQLAQALEDGPKVDVLINNAGVYTARNAVTTDGLDVRFAVNTIAPFVITQRLLPQLGPLGRIVNLSSAAQSTVDPRALSGEVELSDGAAYAQSKTALTAWTRALGLELSGRPSIVAVNPGSLLATKMVMEAFGQARGDVGIGAEVLVRAALDDDFAGLSGEYFDNDVGRFATPTADAADPARAQQIAQLIADVVARVRSHSQPV